MEPEAIARKREKVSVALKGKMVGENNPMYGETTKEAFGESYDGWLIKTRNNLLERNKLMAERKRNQPWLNSFVKDTHIRSYSYSMVFYEHYIKEGISGTKSFNKTHKDKYPPITGTILKKFRDGWNPGEDENWKTFLEI